MPDHKNPHIALCYDFDGTLSPGNMQEFDFIPGLNLTTDGFWNKVKELAKNNSADEILAYMYLMLDEAKHRDISISRESFQDYGKAVELFNGVEGWFDRINKIGKTNNLNIDHFIISSGLKEMIEGTSIKNQFKEIYASSFMYSKDEIAYWPALALNYTTKTQFLFRINKGFPEAWDNSQINEFIPYDQRPIPFKRMIYIGDGATDIPCMRLIKQLGGYALAVYKPNASKAKEQAQKLLDDRRVHYIAPANYEKGNEIDTQITNVIKRIAAEYQVEYQENRQKKS